MPRIALVSRPLRSFQSWEEYSADLAATLASHPADLYLFPEYQAFEIAPIAGAAEDALEQMAAIDAVRDRWLEVHAEAAREARCWLVSGTFPWRGDDGCFRNRAHVFSPDGCVGWQDKQIMTRFETEQLGMANGVGGLRLFDPGGMRFVIAICYDVEFPVQVRRAAEAGAMMVLCPSNTDTWHGYWRVRTGCQARAMENQMFVAQAPMIGRAEWSGVIDENVGRAGVFGPIDLGFPEDGVVACGDDAGGVLVVDLNPAKLDSVRRHGQNRNFRDWDRQFPAE